MTDFIQPDVTTMNAAAYKAAIDQAVAALAQRPPLFNRLLNGDWLIDQVNEGALYTVSAGTFQTVDGWSATAAVAGATGVYKVRRLTDPDFPNQKCLEITCTTADATIAAGDQYYIYQMIEGYDVADLRSGLATAAKITITFDMKFSVAGTYGISLRNAASNRNYVATVTQNLANVRESKVVTLTLDTTGTWLYDTGVGLEVAFCLAAGSTWQGTAGAWGSTPLLTTSSQVNFVSSTSNIGYIGQITLLPGTYGVLSNRPMQGFAEHHFRCERYFQKSFEIGLVPASATSNNEGSYRFAATRAGAVVMAGYHMPWHRPMRAGGNPTVITFNPFVNNPNPRDVTASVDIATWSNFPQSTGMYFVITGNASTAVGDQISVNWTANRRLS